VQGKNKLVLLASDRDEFKGFEGQVIVLNSFAGFFVGCSSLLSVILKYGL
jgi:hypothetical protein